MGAAAVRGVSGGGQGFEACDCGWPVELLLLMMITLDVVLGTAAVATTVDLEDMEGA